MTLWHELFYSRSRLLRVSGSENARLESDGSPLTLSRSERTLFCWFLAKRALFIFHIAASLRLATLVRTDVMAVKRKLKLFNTVNGHNNKKERWHSSYSILVGNGNSLLQSKCSWASRDNVSKRFTKNSQLRAGISFFRKCSKRSLLSMMGRSLTTVSNWKSIHKHSPCKMYRSHISINTSSIHRFFKLKLHFMWINMLHVSQFVCFLTLFNADHLKSWSFDGVQQQPGSGSHSWVDIFHGSQEAAESMSQSILQQVVFCHRTNIQEPTQHGNLLNWGDLTKTEKKR